MDAEAARPSVRRRQVYYIAGFDPRGPLHYHKLYREEAMKQAAVNGLQLTVGPRKTIDALESAWRIETNDTVTDYSYLRWEDLVRAIWPKTGPGLAANILRGFWRWCGPRTGVLPMLLRNCWPCFVCTMCPLAILLGVVLAGIAGAALAFLLLPAAIDPARYLAAVAILVAAGFAVKPVLTHYSANWLTGVGVFILEQTGPRQEVYDKRAAAFAERIAARVRAGDCDEVLVVSHSVGVIPAVKALAHLIPLMPPNAEVSFLSLGQPIAMATYQPGAEQLRAELLAVALSPQIRWIDVTAPADGSCIALTDPVTLSRLERPPGAPVQPKLISARHNKLFTPEGYKKVKRNFPRVHFQYLMATELPGAYDYFLITAGPQTLEERFSGQPSVTGFDKLRLRIP